jgi:glucose-1-phosphate cytidylyltransferase
MTGGRLKRIKKYLNNEDFCFTYGDGLSDIELGRLIKFHKKQKTLATVTATQPPGRFGVLNIKNNKVVSFKEKPHRDSRWINGGFFVLSPKVIDYIQGDETIWENEPMEKLASEGQLSSYRHEGFWKPMDTLRDKNQLEKLWNSGKAPWKVW